MVTINKPIECTVSHNPKGVIRPRRVRYDDQGEDVTFNVDAILSVEQLSVDKQPRQIYRCRSLIHGAAKTYELMFLPVEARWYLYKA